MTDLGSNNHNFEDNFKKLTQQLESVYDSVKTKSDFDNVEVQKDQFMKLFCKAFDWNTEFEDEDDGLQFVHEKDEGNDAFVPVDDNNPASTQQEVKTKNNSKKKNKKNKNKNKQQQQQTLEAKDNNNFQNKPVIAKNKDKDNQEQEKNLDLAAEETDKGIISSTVVTESHKASQNTTAPDTNVISVNIEMGEKLPTEQEEMLTPRGRLRLEHGSFSNTKRPSSSYLAESGTNGIKSQDTKDAELSNGRCNSNVANEIDEEYLAGKGITETNALGLSHNVSSEQSDSTNSANTGKEEVKDNEKTEMTNSVDTLPSLATLRNDWNTQHSNQSWASLSSRSSGSHDNDLMINSYLTAQNGDLSNIMIPNLKTIGPKSGGTDMAFDAMTVQLHAVRQVLRNLILMLLAHHPNGVYDNDLQTEYERMTKTPLEMDDNIEYLLFNHRNVLITPCDQCNLLTLNHQAVQSILEEYGTQEISDVISGHINTIIKLFPDGISANILDEMISNFRGYKLSQILSDPHQFVANNCEVVVHTNEGSSIYFPASSAENKSNLHNYSRVLSSAIGYRELLIALLANHKKPIGIEQLESEFRELFNMPLNACSPVINRILKKINDPALNQEQKQSQLEHASQVLNEANSFRSSLRSSLRSSYNSLKSMVGKFRLAANFELHYEKNRALFELFCPKGRQDTAVIKSPFKEDHRMVFMGGFAHGTSIKELEEALAKYGVKVIDCKGISYRNYGWSFVKVETPEQAEQLAAYSPIQIRGRNIDVRPFIDRKRVKNHQQNRPSANELLEAVLEAVHQTPSGLTVAQVQTNLFHKFQFRVDGTEITKLVSKHAKSLQIKRHPIERIVPTPKMHRLSMEELKSKILKIWTDSENPHDNDKKKEGGEKIKEQKILSLADFENEFARRYKAFLEPRLYGYHSVHELLQSMNDILCFPQVHLQSRVQQQQQQQQGDMIGSSPMARVTETTPTSGGPIGNGNNSTMFNTRNSTGATGRNTLLSNSSPAVGMDQINSNASNMHSRSNASINTTRGVPMPTFSCMPSMQSNYQPIHLMGNSGLPFTMPQMQMYPGNIMPQMSDADMPNSLPTLENFWSLQSIPTEQPFFLPSMSNVGAFSNRSLGSQSPGASKNNMKSAIGNSLNTNLANQTPLPLFNQLSNGSQLMTPTKHMG